MIYDLQIHLMRTFLVYIYIIITCHWTRFFLPRDTLEFPRMALPPRETIPSNGNLLTYTLLLNSRENGSRVSPRSIPFPTIPIVVVVVSLYPPIERSTRGDSRGGRGGSQRDRPTGHPSNAPIMDHRCKRIEGR